MSRTGEIVFYSNHCHDYVSVAKNILLYLRPDKIEYIYISLKADNTWMAIDAGDEPAYEKFPRLVEPHELPDLILRETSAGRSVHIALDSSLGSTLSKSIISKIPEEVRSRFAPGDVIFRVGMHDIVGVATDRGSDPVFLGRVPISISFWGYDCPNYWDAYEEMVPALPEFIEIRSRLSEILGEVKHVMHWDV